MDGLEALSQYVHNEKDPKAALEATDLVNQAARLVPGSEWRSSDGSKIEVERLRKPIRTEEEPIVIFKVDGVRWSAPLRKFFALVRS